MLKQNYIIIDSIPEREKDMLRKNLTGSSEWKAAELAAGFTAEKIRRLTQYPTENSMVLSGDEKLLSGIKESGMARIGFSNSGKTIFGVDMMVEGLDEVDERFLTRIYRRKHHLPWMILETERCTVREITLEDLDALFELYAAPEMTAYMEPLYEYAKEKEYQRAYIAHMYGFYGYGMWLVQQKDSGKIIGRAGLENREELGGEIELGYAIGVPYQKQGYATEVCGAILRYAKEELGCGRVNCLIETGNTISLHLAEKLGFTFQGSLIIDQKEMKQYVYAF